MSDTTYATVTTLRSYPGIPASGEDTYLQSLLNAAAGLVDGWCNTTFVSTTATAETHDGTGSRFLHLLHRPVISVTTVTLDTSTLSTDAYEIDYAQGTLVIPYDSEDERNPRIWRRSGGDNDGWPVGTRNIAVTYTYGYSAVPDGVSTATCMIAAGLYQDGQRRGVSAESLGPRSITYDKAQGGLPPAAAMLLQRYVEHEVRG